MKAVRVSSNDTEGFNQTIEWKFLQLTSTTGNSNKFILLELQKNDSDEYRIYSETGRIGSSPQSWVRSGYTDITQTQSDFDKIIKSKTQKNRKDAANQNSSYSIVDVVSPSCGSDNIRRTILKGETSNNKNTRKAFSSIKDDKIKKLLNSFVDANIHALKVNSSITFDTEGNASTAFGPVTQEHIDRAYSILTDMQNILQNSTRYTSIEDIPRNFVKLVDKYFAFIPREMSSKIGFSDIITTDQQLISEFELLDNLSAAVTINPVSDIEEDIKLPFFIEEASKKDSMAIIKTIEDSRKHHQLDMWKPVSVYKVTIENERKNYIEKNKKLNMKEYDLFHGSNISNILAILMGGLIIPPVNSPNVTGRMFGNGIYAASSSTKALNYSAGYWDKKSVGNKIYMFMVKFSMGKIYECQSSFYGGCPSGYNSIHAKAGKSLIHDEFIVPEIDQCTIQYIIEFDKMQN